MFVCIGSEAVRTMLIQDVQRCLYHQKAGRLRLKLMLDCLFLWARIRQWRIYDYAKQ